MQRLTKKEVVHKIFEPFKLDCIEKVFIELDEEELDHIINRIFRVLESNPNEVIEEGRREGN